MARKSTAAADTSEAARRRTDPARRLAGVRAALAAHPLRAPRLPVPVIDAIRDAGLWKIWVPPDCGGEALGLPEALDLVIAGARLEGSVGFALAIGAGGGLFGAWLPAATAREMYTPPEALVAGSGAPDGIAVPVPEGLRVSGHWRWASLIHDATWVTAAVRITGSERIAAIAVPASAADIGDTWHAHAMAATDSHDIRLADRFVPDSHVFSLFEPPRIDDPLYRFDFMALSAAVFAAVAVGTAAGALDAVLETAVERPAPDPLRDAALARASGDQRAARAVLDTSVTATWETVVRGHEPDPAAVNAVRIAANTATRLSVQAVDRLTEAAGMRLLLETDRLSRCWRDVHGVAQHALVSAARDPDFGRLLAGRSPEA